MFFKKIKKLFNDVAEIKTTLTEESKQKVQEADDQLKYIKEIKFNVKKVIDTIDENGKPALLIIYEVPKTLLRFDDSGEVLSNEQFRAINSLNLISMSDKIMIAKKVSEKKI